MWKKGLNRFALAAAVLGQFHLQLLPAQRKENTRTMPITADLNILVSNSTVKAHLVIRNGSSGVIYLEKSKVFAGGEILNSLFEITSGETSIPYIGKMAKLRRPGPEDFLDIHAGQQYEVTVDISNAYAFLPGSHQYAVVYKAFHSYPDRDGYWTLESNSATFTLRK